MLIDIPQFESITLLIYTDHEIFTSDLIVAKLRIKNYLESLKQWADEWVIIINPDKTWVQHLTNNTKARYQDIQVIYTKLKYTDVQKIFRILVDSSNITMKDRIGYLKSDFLHRLNVMNVFFSSKWGSLLKNHA